MINFPAFLLKKDISYIIMVKPMKIQDLAFLLVFLIILTIRNDRLATLAGLACLLLAIPLFNFWIFFTAQRLVMYAAAFFALSIIFQILRIRRNR